MKLYYTQRNIGKAKYVINYHNGIKKHKDGSAFYDVAIHSNKKDHNDFAKKLVSQGYEWKIKYWKYA